MKPVVDGLEKEWAGRVEFRRLNVETDPKGVELANTMGVQYVPTFVFVNADGVTAGQVVGEQTKDSLEKALGDLK